MTDYQIVALLVSLTALLAYLNARFLRLPPAIGLMAIALAGSLALVGLDAAGVADLVPRIAALLERVDFDDALLHGMLGLLLFAGALHVDLGELGAQRGTIAALALGGTLLSTALVGCATFALLELVGSPLPLLHCLLFGALISPTDPIAVLGILKSARVPPTLETTIAGESLFNDGVGVVVFLGLFGAATGGDVGAGDLARLFLQEAVGGAAFGLATGYLAYRLLKTIDQYSVEILITLALVLGGYAAAEALHLSAPIAAVCAGLLVGNQGRALAMSDTTRDHLDTFWELIDEILNAVLFLLIGLEVVRLRLTTEVVLAGAALIPLVLCARLASVSLPLAFLRRFRAQAPRAALILTWGGLRGGISVALALSLPPGRPRDILLVLTYLVVAVSILVQGLTLGPLLRRLTPAGSPPP